MVGRITNQEAGDKLLGLYRDDTSVGYTNETDIEIMRVVSNVL